MNDKEPSGGSALVPEGSRALASRTNALAKRGLALIRTFEADPGEQASDAGSPAETTDVVMPQLGESIAEGTVVRWIKKVGDMVDRDELLVEISTDKVDAEIPSPAAGVLTEIRVNEGETVSVHSIVAVISRSRLHDDMLRRAVLDHIDKLREQWGADVIDNPDVQKAIVAHMDANPRATLVESTRMVVMKRISADRTTMRAELLAELKVTPKAAAEGSAAPTNSDAGADRPGVMAAVRHVLTLPTSASRSNPATSCASSSRSATRSPKVKRSSNSRPTRRPSNGHHPSPDGSRRSRSPRRPGERRSGILTVIQDADGQVLEEAGQQCIADPVPCFLRLRSKFLRGRTQVNCEIEVPKRRTTRPKKAS